MDGIIVIYKEKGYTSFDVVAKLRGILGQKKIGHTGTLDPDAEGVLPICLGKATKICEFLTEKDKVYDAVLRLGITTDTQDMTGTVLRSTTPVITEEKLLELISGFQGIIKQIPPMYSALKVNGQKLCDLARQGIEIERKAREIEIFSIDSVKVKMPQVSMRIHCSKGTYIRTLCHDIGEVAGFGGCMEYLLRVATAGFTLENAYRIQEIEDIVKGKRANTTIQDILIPVDEVLKEYPAVYTDESGDKLLQNGNKVSKEAIVSVDGEISEQCRMYNSARQFVGIYKYNEVYGEFKSVKMFL